MPASTSSFVAPSGISRPTTPANTRSVALPRIHGPSTDSPTLSTTHASIAYIVDVSGLNWASSRFPDALKSMEFWSGPPAIIRPIGPAIRQPPLP